MRSKCYQRNSKTLELAIRGVLICGQNAIREIVKRCAWHSLHYMPLVAVTLTVALYGRENCCL